MFYLQIAETVNKKIFQLSNFPNCLQEPKAGNSALLYLYTHIYLINEKLCLQVWMSSPASHRNHNSASEDRNQAQDSIKTKEWKTSPSANASIFNALV